jgi:hypothetical protein
MHLAQIEKAGLSPCEVTMADRRARVGVALDAVPLDESDAVAQRLAEVMTGVCRDGYDAACKKGFIHLRRPGPKLVVDD